MKVEQITTPALLVDLDAMESNLHRMAMFFADKPCKLRPHFKNHKSPLLAWKQMRSGAIGMTCATMREAEILVHHGIDSILIANEIADDTKAELLADLSRHTFRKRLYQVPSSTITSRRTTSPAVTDPAFLPITVLADPPRTDSTPHQPLELILSHGHRIAVAPGFDAHTLRRLLTVLEGPPCSE